MSEERENEDIREPVRIRRDEFLVGTWQEDYPLTEVEFERIKDGRPKTIDLMIALLGAAAGYSLALISKLLDSGLKSLTSGEKYVVLGIFLAILALFVAGLLIPNKRKTTLRKIGSHFGSTTKSRHVVERTMK